MIFKLVDGNLEFFERIILSVLELVQTLINQWSYILSYFLNLVAWKKAFSSGLANLPLYYSYRIYAKTVQIQ